MSAIAFSYLDQAVVARRGTIIDELAGLVAAGGLITSEDECRAFETDAFASYSKMPLAVVLPTSTDEVSAVLKYCHDNNVKVVPRGAGTSLAGGAIPARTRS